VGEITLNEHLRRMREKRWRNATKEERQKATSLAGRAAWANFTPEERSVEMKRRAKVRESNRAVKAKASKKRKPKSLNSNAEEATQAFLRAVKEDVDAARGPRR
jgi:hypothetical protein